jgi:hypothetical protein
MTANKLKLNNDKTEIMLLTPKSCKKNFQNISIKIGQEMIKPTISARNIGVIFDNHLTLNQHVNNVCKATYLQLRNIGSIRRHLNQDTCEQLVHALISSRIDYGNTLMFGLPNTILNRLQKILNTAARITTLTRKHSHITPVLQGLHWLKIEERIAFKILTMTHNVIYKEAPNYIADLLSFYSPSTTYNLRSLNKCLLNVPSPNLKTYGYRSYNFSAPTLWNSLPENIRCCPSYSTFKSLLKTHLFNYSYSASVN